MDLLFHELKKSMFVVSDDAGSNRVSFELNGITTSVETTLLQMTRVVQQLPPAARKAWLRSKARNFSIGLQAEVQPYSAVFPVSNKTLQAVADCGATLDITVYAPPKKRSVKRAA